MKQSTTNDPSHRPVIYSSDLLWQGKPDLVVLHGTHDHALGMSPAIADLSQHYDVVALDLRGHGHSDKPGNYAMLGRRWIAITLR